MFWSCHQEFSDQLFIIINDRYTTNSNTSIKPLSLVVVVNSRRRKSYGTTICLLIAEHAESKELLRVRLQEVYYIPVTNYDTSKLL